ncbi:MAG: BamA/TamA family outer membrane protein [Cyclobacteriaceae bacterium]
MLAFQSGKAQSIYELEIVGDPDGLLTNQLKEISFSDSTTLKSHIHEVIGALQKQGYWLANLDRLSFDGDRALLKVFVGKKFNDLLVAGSNLDFASQRKLGLSDKKLPKSYSTEESSQALDKIVAYYNNHGYPFASAKLDSFKMGKNRLHCEISVAPGRIILLDSLGLTSPPPATTRFLSQYFGLELGSLYSQKTVDEIVAKSKRLAFLKLEEEPTVYFALQKAKLQLSLAEVKANVFDGIIGLVPGTNGAKSDINGELNLELKNLFRSGKSFDFHWKKITTKTQQLNVSYYHPFIFSSPLSMSLAFDQLKENTVFSNRKLTFGLELLAGAYSNIGFNFQNRQGNTLQDFDEASGDFDVNFYGLNFTYDKLDDPTFPKQGIYSTLNARVGLKNISSNSLTPSDVKKSNQYEFSGLFDLYHPMSKRSVLHARLTSGIMENDKLFLNDLFRVGGLNSIRGFNENHFFASKYALASIEWQIYLEANSLIFLFYDQAVLERQVFSGSTSAKPSGLGAGVKMSVKNGMFNLIYGLGNPDTNGFSFDQSKVHFGYTGRF